MEAELISYYDVSGTHAFSRAQSPHTPKWACAALP